MALSPTRLVSCVALLVAVGGAWGRVKSAEAETGEASTLEASAGSAESVPSGAALHPREVAVPWGEKVALERDVTLLAWSGADAKPGYSGSLMVGRNGGRIKVQTVKVSTGRVDTIIAPAEVERGVLLAGPDAISAISSWGRLAFSVTEKKVYVEVLWGEALSGAKGRFKKLLPGIVRVYDRVTGRSSDEAQSAAPRFVAARGLAVALSGGAPLVVRAVGEGTFCVALTNPAGQQLGESRCGAGGDPLELWAPHAGMFQAVGRRLAEGSMGSALSEPVPLQVLGLAEGQKPPVDGVFLLERWERVSLRGTDGLELRYGVSDMFVPASPSVGLPDGRGTTVEFRDPDLPEQRTVLRLAPRYGKVETSIRPANARWPGPSLHMTVKAVDGAGKLIREGEDLQLRVSINGRLFFADWAFSKRGLETRVPPRQGEGPWVVRLSVLDDQGRTIARDVIDVIER